MNYTRDSLRDIIHKRSIALVLVLQAVAGGREHMKKHE